MAEPIDYKAKIHHYLINKTDFLKVKDRMREDELRIFVDRAISDLCLEQGINIPTRTPFCKAWCNRLQMYVAQSDCVELRHLFDAQQDVDKRVQAVSMELVGYAKRKGEN